MLVMVLHKIVLMTFGFTSAEKSFFTTYFSRILLSLVSQVLLAHTNLVRRELPCEVLPQEANPEEVNERHELINIIDRDGLQSESDDHLFARLVN